MNKDNAKDYLPLVQALADGKTIQFNCYSDGNWIDSFNPGFDAPASRYRIKPEPFEAEIWVSADGNIFELSRMSDCYASANGYRKIKVREVES